MQERPTVFIHIGAAKTGTTYLQGILRKNRETLRNEGVLYPGEAIRSHFFASMDLRESPFLGHTDKAVPGAWGRLVDEIRPWPDRSIIDHETLAEARRGHIDRALSDLDFADVHVIWTARDIARQLPAVWQESLKNRDTITFATYLEDVRAGLTGKKPQQLFWSVQAAPRILSRWARDLPRERVHVVTLPPPGGDRTLLWRRFAGVLGVDPAACETEVATRNDSLTAAEAAVLRDLNELLTETDLPWPVYRTTIKHGIPAQLEEHSGRPIELPESAYAWALEWSHRAVALLHKAGYHVVGDLAELVPSARPVGDDPDHPRAADRAEAATRMLAALAKVVAAQTAPDPVTDPATAQTAPDPVTDPAATLKRRRGLRRGAGRATGADLLRSMRARRGE